MDFIKHLGFDSVDKDGGVYLAGKLMGQIQAGWSNKADNELLVKIKWIGDKSDSLEYFRTMMR